MTNQLKQTKFDMHTHGPWTFWKPLPGLIGKLIDKALPEKTIDNLLELYLPFTEEDNIAIGMCNYLADRYSGLITKLTESSEERKRIKTKYSLRDIDTTSSEYFIGFKNSNGNQFYMIKGQEPHLTEGHLLLLPMQDVLPVKKQVDGKSVFKTPEELAQDARQDPLTLIIGTHPGMNLSALEKFALRLVGEPSSENLGLTYEKLQELAEQGLLDGTEEYNSGAGKHNKEIEQTTTRLHQTHGIPAIANSDTMYPDNILTAYTVMDLDLTTPEKLSQSMRQALQTENYKTETTPLKASTFKQLKHFLIHLSMPKSHQYL